MALKTKKFSKKKTICIFYVKKREFNNSLFARDNPGPCVITISFDASLLFAHFLVYLRYCDYPQAIG